MPVITFYRTIHSLKISQTRSCGYGRKLDESLRVVGLITLGWFWREDPAGKIALHPCNWIEEVRAAVHRTGSVGQ